MEPYTIARVVLLPNGDIHIAYHTRQTYYCTARALLLLLSEPLQFAERGKSFLDISTYVVSKNLDPVDKVQGLTLLTVYSDKHFVCEFSELFKLMYSPYILSSAEADQNMYLSLERLQSFLRDDKQDLIRLYMAYTQSAFASGQRRKQKIDISTETQSKIVSEIVNTTLKATLKRTENEGDIAPVMKILNEKANIQDRIFETDANFQEAESADIVGKDNSASSTKDTFMTLEEFAVKHNVKPRTVKDWIYKEKIKSVKLDENNQYWVNSNETVMDRRANRTVEEKTDGSGRKYIRLKGSSYTDIQKYIEERGLVTSAIRPFIRTYEEIKYYEKHSYHEVNWEIGSAMIIDINPDYYCKSEGKTNREIISSGSAPVVPQNEGFRFHLHHIGQQTDSPFAIIPGYDHNSPQYYSIFHQGKASKEDLHDKYFEEQKRNFWKAYLEYYDQYGTFARIPYLNPKNKRKQVK